MRRMAIIIEWPDGAIDKGPNPEFVLRQIADYQWNPVSTAEMRHLLSNRAWVLLHEAIDPTLPIEEFFTKLDEAGMLRIIEWEEEELPT